MKRDLDLSRAILQQIEEKSDGRGCPPLVFPDRTPQEVSYHVKLLQQGGLIDASDLSTMHGMDFRPKSLTSAGHDFLEAIRNDTVWNNVKDHAKKKGIELPFSMLSGLAMDLVRSVMNLI